VFRGQVFEGIALGVETDTGGGVFVAGPIAMMVTPFLADWSIDLGGLRRVAELALRQGASGLAVHGLASEGYKLLDRERVEIVAAIAEVIASPLLIAGVDHEATAGSIELARSVAGAGATAVMAMPPKTSGGARARIVAYYQELEDRGGLPIVIQDAPRASGIQMDADTLLAIVSGLRLENAIKVEDAIPPLKIARLTAALAGNGRTVLYGGAGGRRFLSELEAGASGTMVGPAFIDVFGQIQALWKTDPGEALAVFEDCAPLLNAVEGNEWYALLQKALLFRAGLIANPGLRPPAIGADPGYLEGLVQLYLRTAPRQRRLGADLYPMLQERGRAR
jgi:2-keto-3-deoxy-L-arabinonate dehydratase